MKKSRSLNSIEKRLRDQLAEQMNPRKGDKEYRPMDLGGGGGQFSSSNLKPRYKLDTETGKPQLIKPAGAIGQELSDLELVKLAAKVGAAGGGLMGLGGMAAAMLMPAPEEKTKPTVDKTQEKPIKEKNTLRLTQIEENLRNKLAEQMNPRKGEKDYRSIEGGGSGGYTGGYGDIYGLGGRGGAAQQIDIGLGGTGGRPSVWRIGPGERKASVPPALQKPKISPEQARAARDQQQKGTEVPKPSSGPQVTGKEKTGLKIKPGPKITPDTKTGLEVTKPFPGRWHNRPSKKKELSPDELAARQEKSDKRRGRGSAATSVGLHAAALAALLAAQKDKEEKSAGGDQAPENVIQVDLPPPSKADTQQGVLTTTEPSNWETTSGANVEPKSDRVLPPVVVTAEPEKQPPSKTEPKAEPKPEPRVTTVKPDEKAGQDRPTASTEPVTGRSEQPGTGADTGDGSDEPYRRRGGLFSVPVPRKPVPESLSKVLNNYYNFLNEAETSTYSKEQYLGWAKKYADQHGVPLPVVLHAMYKETGWLGDPERMRTATSPTGARGVMQIQPQYAEKGAYKIKVKDLTDPEKNIEAGVRGLAYYLNKHKTPEKALAAYNAGEGGAANFLKTGNIKFLPKETKKYIQGYKDDVIHQLEKFFPKNKQKVAQVATDVLATAVGAKSAQAQNSKDDFDAKMADLEKEQIKRRQELERDEKIAQELERRAGIKRDKTQVATPVAVTDVGSKIDKDKTAVISKPFGTTVQPDWSKYKYGDLGPLVKNDQGQWTTLDGKKTATDPKLIADLEKLEPKNQKKDTSKTDSFLDKVQRVLPPFLGGKGEMASKVFAKDRKSYTATDALGRETTYVKNKKGQWVTKDGQILPMPEKPGSRQPDTLKPANKSDSEVSTVDKRPTGTDTSAVPATSLANEPSKTVTKKTQSYKVTPASTAAPTSDVALAQPKIDVRKEFEKEFARQRKQQGAGGTFDWTNPVTSKTSSYTTDYKTEVPKSAPVVSKIDTVDNSALDQKSNNFDDLVNQFQKELETLDSKDMDNLLLDPGEQIVDLPLPDLAKVTNESLSINTEIHEILRLAGRL
jgi:hypothetical protein